MSTTATNHYHGTSMTAMQFLSNESRGETQDPPTYDQNQHVNCSKKVLQIPSSYTQAETFYLKKRKYHVPVCTVNSFMYLFVQLTVLCTCLYS